MKVFLSWIIKMLVRIISGSSVGLSIMSKRFRAVSELHHIFRYQNICIWRRNESEWALRKYFSTTLALNNKLLIEPLSCLHDEITHVKAVGVKPGAKVTITASAQDTKGQNFFSYAYYLASGSGIVDLNEAESFGGTFQGKFPMGHIACLRPSPNEFQYLRYFKRDVHSPTTINFRLLNGHVEEFDAFKPGSSIILDTATHTRIYMAPGVERVPVKHGNIRGTLFLPAGEGPFPGVIDLFGTAGGLIEHRSAQFASRGIASLALAYFAYDDLPQNLEVLDISYFEEAARFLLSSSKVKKSSIGAIGVSKGGDIVCSMGAFLPMVKAVVCINGVPVNTWCPLIVNGKAIPGLRADASRIEVLNPQLMSSLHMMDDSEDFPETFLPLHESDAQFLFLISKDDKNWMTELETERATQRMKAKGNSNWKIVKYEGAGHLLEPPFSPFCEASFHKLAGSALLWGGKQFDHCKAQVQSWQEILHFFKANIT